jgi:hypothetical protein
MDLFDDRGYAFRHGDGAIGVVSRRYSEREAMKYIGATSATCRNGVARSSVKRFALPLVGGLLALVLASCETGSSSSSDGVVSSLTDTPKEQSPGQAKPVAFAPVIGAPAKISSKMNERLVAAAGQSNLPVAASGEAEYTVRGYLVAAADPQGAKLSYIWDITDKGGKRAKRFQGDELIEGKKGGDPWALVDDAAIDRIASSTATKIATWMSGTEASPATASSEPQATASSEPQAQPVATTQASAAPQPADAPAPTANVLAAQTDQPSASSSQSSGEIVAVVHDVTGAPGDGQASLTAAMRRHLESAGVKLVDNSSNAYSVRGSVQLGSADAGQQPITIRWTVIDPAGKTMEKAVVQRNKVPAGSLNGEWGQIADLAAGEAAKSVAKLIKPTG